MKQIIFPTLAMLLAGTALTGCISVQLDSKKPTPAPKIQVQSASTQVAPVAPTTSYSRFDQKNNAILINYACSESATIVAKHTNQSGYSLKANIPSWKINNQEIKFDLDSKSVGSSSGIRYTNNTNPASLYEWQVKGNQANLSVKIGKDTYRISCQATPAGK